MNLIVVEHIHELIQSKRTGSPKEFASKMGLSERMIYNYIKFMKEELKAPIKYSHVRRSYVYEQEGNFKFRWSDKT